MLIISWVFSRWMALIYLAAFWSLGVQILGLVGSHGILPVGNFLHYVSQQEGAGRFWAAPTLCWLNSSDSFLLFLCWGGAFFSILLLFGIMPGLTAFLLWALYLSLTIAGQEFYGFQWDNLLLEAGLLLIFLVPRPFGLHLKPFTRPSTIIVWLFRLLLFKLMFESGLVKLLSGDTNWADLTALTYHYWTQPLPNVISWYAAQLPLWFQKLSCFLLFVIELIFPFFIFFGRWARLIAFFGITIFQLLILLTGNYCFFNLLAIGLCLTLLEDDHLAFMKGTDPWSSRGLSPSKLYKIITWTFAIFILLTSGSLVAGSFGRMTLSKPIQDLITFVSPLRSINNYGLFAVMTTQRDEIILEGSYDGEIWLPYEFPFKPGDVFQAPGWAVPYQPRLDWQMWFAALSDWRQEQWLMVLMERLLQGEPSVLRLLAKDPFGGHPPQYIRASFWEYHFTDPQTRVQTKAWWLREEKGLYCPTVSLLQ